MASLGRRIEKALPKVQPRVEDMLEVSLGYIEVRPITALIRQLLDESVYGIHPLVKGLMTVGYRIANVRSVAAVKAERDNSTIYHGSSLLGLLYSDRNIEGIVTHELAHLAHLRLIDDKIKPAELPRSLVEGFAEHVRREVISEMYGKSFESMFNLMQRRYGQAAQFRQRLTEQGIRDNKSLVDYIRAQTAA